MPKKLYTEKLLEKYFGKNWSYVEKNLLYGKEMGKYFGNKIVILWLMEIPIPKRYKNIILNQIMDLPLIISFTNSIYSISLYIC